VVLFVLDGGSPFVETTLTASSGKLFQPRLAVDTGCGGYALVMLSKSFVDRYGVMAEMPDRAADPQFGSAGQQARVATARFEKFAVGPFEIPRPKIHFWQVQGFGGASGPDGLLCGDFLRRFKLIFDYPNKRIVLVPNAHFRD